ncbi:hypothetical protein GT020_10400 [Glutamicibacter soli]|uniref:Uncharacterized protein n=1 Tax=Glutamicibacter soli TaxID=453836 RepID=A0A6L9G7V5_9MICC|nr:hypothetical protein [Glutamicibacter soli]NAZ16470.1 hypothetical protein [Glutamicibacter soli]
MHLAAYSQRYASVLLRRDGSLLEVDSQAISVFGTVVEQGVSGKEIVQQLLAQIVQQPVLSCALH